MARWKKRLLQMLNDSDPRNYYYEEAARILAQLGFAEASNAGTSHRKWKLRKGDGSLIVIGLVEKGHGPLRPVYVREMIKQLVAHDLIPHDHQD